MDITLESATPSFKNIQLFKEETLGIGSYGKVCRAKCDSLPCAAKIIHGIFIDPTAVQQTSGHHEHRHPLKRFEQECRVLNRIRHPNIIQYLGIYTDPDTGHPVLLMELMDESLTHFLETATQQIPYHIQINVCHDIAMALTFLHTNGIVHRDLSGNNVLLISNVRAKVTDFGMAKLSDINPRTSRLTFTKAPGTDVYMPPEAVQDQPAYSEKIDCFSFGVIVLQILTRQFPKPGERMQTVEINHPDFPKRTLMMCIPEIERRQNHINRVNSNHTLLPISLECLKDRDVERPSAQQICESIATLKGQSMYTDSMTGNEKKERGFDESKVRDSQQQSQLLSEYALPREVQELLSAKDKEITAKEFEIQNLIRSRDESIQKRDREIQQLREQLQDTNNIKSSSGGLTAAKPLEPTIEIEMQRMSITDRQECATLSDIKLQWRMGKPALESMYRWCNAVVGVDEVYVNASGKKIVYIYNINSELWIRSLAECPNINFSLAIVDGQVIAIGGIAVNFLHKFFGSIFNAPPESTSDIIDDDKISTLFCNKIYTLKKRLRQEQWVQEIVPMPTKRSSTTSICTQRALIVAGGKSAKSSGQGLTLVEAMDRETGQWSTASDMPCGVHWATGVICGNRLYVGGGMSNSVFCCLLSDLLQSCQLQSATQTTTASKQPSASNTAHVWGTLSGSVLYGSTLVSVCDHLVAIGGRSGEYSRRPSKSVYIYQRATNCWEGVDQMSELRSFCFAVILPSNKVMVVGGIGDNEKHTATVEFADIN